MERREEEKGVVKLIVGDLLVPVARAPGRLRPRPRTESPPPSLRQGEIRWLPRRRSRPEIDDSEDESP
jgi:hypothetical protein